jgi:acyl-CoA dehydrogenase
MGWLASDTATLYFDDCRIPAANLIGAENSGFSALTDSFNDERLGLAASSIGFARLAYEEAKVYANERVTFGKKLIQHQVIRHKLVDMAQRIEASQAYLELTAWKLDHGLNPIADVCMLKNQATQTLAHCASDAVQIFGGAGYLRGTTVERIYRDVKPNVIGGGSEEIMKELAGRHLV